MKTANYYYSGDITAEKKMDEADKYALYRGSKIGEYCVKERRFAGMYYDLTLSDYRALINIADQIEMDYMTAEGCDKRRV